MYVIKARTHGCVRNDSETHSTGVTGLHSGLRRSCNPVTQSRAFHCHFAHIRAFSLYYHTRPIVSRDEDYVCESPLGDFKFRCFIVISHTSVGYRYIIEGDAHGGSCKKWGVPSPFAMQMIYNVLYSLPLKAIIVVEKYNWLDEFSTGKIFIIWKTQWKHSYLAFWFAGNGLTPTTNK